MDIKSDFSDDLILREVGERLARTRLERNLTQAQLAERAGISKRTLERYGTEIGRVARVMPLMLANAVLWNAPAIQVVIVGAPGAADTRALEAVVAARLLPWAVQVPLGPGAGEGALSATLPWLGAMTMRGGRATAYVCKSFACQEPVTDPAALERQLDDAGARIIG
jgi:uncharacterized protein YyaL (SSP411 family)